MKRVDSSSSGVAAHIVDAVELCRSARGERVVVTDVLKSRVQLPFQTAGHHKQWLRHFSLTERAILNCVLLCNLSECENQGMDRRKFVLAAGGAAPGLTSRGAHRRQATIKWHELDDSERAARHPLITAVFRPI
jgi:hypothetical protein